jgi:hypothetical protein
MLLAFTVRAAESSTCGFGGRGGKLYVLRYAWRLLLAPARRRVPQRSKRRYAGDCGQGMSALID